MNSFTPFFLLAFLFLSCNDKKPDTSVHNPLLGAWDMKQINWITKDTVYKVEKAQPGMFIFSPRHYSIMWSSLDKPRTPFKDLSHPTDKEMIDGFSTIVFNAGSYVFTDSTVTSTAKVAKVPGFEGGKQFYRYTVKNDTLQITMFDETYPNGEKPRWLGRYVTRFILTRSKND